MYIKLNNNPIFTHYLPSISMCRCKSKVYPIYSVMRTCRWCGRTYDNYRSGGFCGEKCDREHRAATYTPTDSSEVPGGVVAVGCLIAASPFLFLAGHTFINAKWKWNEIIAFVAIGVIVLVGLCGIVAVLGEKDTDDPG